MRNDAANIFYEMKIFQDQDFWMIFADLPIFYLLGDNKQKFLILSVYSRVKHSVYVCILEIYE